MPLFGLVLDVGCGTGLLFDHVVDRAETVVGLDISKKTLIIAGRRSKAFPEVNLIRADADWLPLAEGIFDYVFAVTLIQNVPDPLETLREIDRVSRDDAVVVVTGLKKVFSRGEFLKLLRKSEFKVLSLKEGEDLKCFVANCSKLYHKNR